MYKLSFTYLLHCLVYIRVIYMMYTSEPVPAPFAASCLDSMICKWLLASPSVLMSILGHELWGRASKSTRYLVLYAIMQTFLASRVHWRAHGTMCNENALPIDRTARRWFLHVPAYSSIRTVSSQFFFEKLQFDDATILCFLWPPIGQAIIFCSCDFYHSSFFRFPCLFSAAGELILLHRSCSTEVNQTLHAVWSSPGLTHWRSRRSRAGGGRTPISWGSGLWGPDATKIWLLGLILLEPPRKFTEINVILEMWANAQPDGRPAEYRWRPLFNAAKFGW